MSDELVTVATFNLHPQALLAKSMLEAAGLACWLRDEHVGRMYAGIQAMAFGGIQLQVRREDEQAARTILSEAESTNSVSNGE